MAQKRPTTALLILDGWGHREAAPDNAIAAAATPFWDQLLHDCPHTLLDTSGLSVGLPAGQMGNSEVGHMNLGAGRVVYQSLTRIDKAIADGDFQKNPQLLQAIDQAVHGDKALHLLGLLSPGGVHSHEDHWIAACQLAAERGIQKLCLHAFLDGRDMPPRSAEASLQKMQDALKNLGVGRIASLVGRYFAMDRDNRWDRIERAYDLLTLGHAAFESRSAIAALHAAYARGENDEFVQPVSLLVEGEPPATINDGDSVIFMNFRSDRARELTRAFTESGLNDFARKKMPRLANFVTLTEYAADIAAPCIFPPENLSESLGEVMQTLGKTQLRIAETEKYAHVTFFFSGGREAPFVGEDRILVPSPQVATYDLKPEMSAPEVTDKLVAAIEGGQYDLIVCNYANGDMVGHTGNFDAAVKAAVCIDQCLARIVAALRATGGQCLITADHGNCEQMSDAHTGQRHTAHTLGPVPLVYVGPQALQLKPGGALSDVAPTLLALMAIPQPKAMSGHSLAS